MYPNNTDPKPPSYASQPAGKWTTGLCGCSEDFSNCCVTCCCPCVTFGINAEIMDRGQTSCACGVLIFYALLHMGCACLYTCTYRTKLRAFYSLPEDPCNDCCVHCWWHSLRPLSRAPGAQNRGLDPTIGWIANAQKMNGGTTTPPFVAPGMTR